MKKPQNSSIQVTYIGGPTIILEYFGIRFMTDPTLDPKGAVYRGTITKTESPSITDIGTIDIVLLSHDHHLDNLDQAGRRLLKNVSRTYTTVVGSERLKGTCIGLSNWQSDTIISQDGREITITATPARHGPAGMDNGEVIGFLLSVKGEETSELYITGDTVYFEGIADVATKYNPSYVFIFAGAAQPLGPFNVTMANNDAIDTAFAFPKATIIPLHYNGWSHYTQNEKDLQRAFKLIGIDHRLKILEAGAPIRLPFVSGPDMESQEN